MENKRYHIIIASIIFALSVWLSVNLGHEYTVSVQIPVVIDNLQTGRALKYPVPKFLNVRFKGPGWSIVGLFFSPDIKYFIDVSTINTENFILTSRDLFEHIKLPIDVHPVDASPETLMLALDLFNEKRVPVNPHISLNFRSGYGQVGPVRLYPESVIIGGAKNMVEKITNLQTVYRRFEDLRTSINEVIPLEEPTHYSLDLSLSSVRLLVNVQPFAEKTFVDIPISATMVPSGKEIIFIPPKMDIIVRGGIEQLSKLTSSDFQATINYTSLLPDSTNNVTPTLIYPEEVRVINRTPEQFKYIIRKKL